MRTIPFSRYKETGKPVYVPITKKFYNSIEEISDDFEEIPNTGYGSQIEKFEISLEAFVKEELKSFHSGIDGKNIFKLSEEDEAALGKLKEFESKFWGEFPEHRIFIPDYRVAVDLLS